MPDNTRIEHDSMGEVAVPADRLWGAQTERSRQLFTAGGERYRWRREVIQAFGYVKQAAAEANGELGELDAERAALIVAAAAEVAEGRHDAHFPLLVFQTGSGTQSNMNANEVIANRANQSAGQALGRYAPVHPNDHVNRGQSSNDVFPAVMHLAALQVTDGHLQQAVARTLETLRQKSAECEDVIMVGRTHMQDATPIRLADVIRGWEAQVSQAWTDLAAALTGLEELPLGGTAVGTGLNAHPRFGGLAVAHLARLTGRPLRPAGNLVAAISAHDAMARVSAAVRGLAGTLLKMANDLRLYVSGPRAGLGELSLPENEPGSSIMPGKTNPTQVEALSMAALYVFGADAAVAMANAQGPLQLNVYKPLILHGVMESIVVLGDALSQCEAHALRGLTANRERIKAHLDEGLMLATALSPHVGYERAAAVARRAHTSGTTLREAARAEGISDADFDRWVDPAAMAGPRPAS